MTAAESTESNAPGSRRDVVIPTPDEPPHEGWYVQPVDELVDGGLAGERDWAGGLGEPPSGDSHSRRGGWDQPPARSPDMRTLTVGIVLMFAVGVAAAGIGTLIDGVHGQVSIVMTVNFAIGVAWVVTAVLGLLLAPVLRPPFR